MKITNLTPHSISILAEDGTHHIFAPSGEIARLAVSREARPSVEIDGISIGVVSPTMGEITGLPAAQAGVIFVVSALVAEKAQRADVMSPGELIRDAAGIPVGAKGLCAYGPALPEQRSSVDILADVRVSTSAEYRAAHPRSQWDSDAEWSAIDSAVKTAKSTPEYLAAYSAETQKRANQEADAAAAKADTEKKQAEEAAREKRIADADREYFRKQRASGRE